MIEFLFFVVAFAGIACFINRMCHEELDDDF